MKPYVMTEADVQLIQNFAGALNSGRVQLPVSDRFGILNTPAVAGSPSVKWSHADELAALATRAAQPDDPISTTPVSPPKPGESRVSTHFNPNTVYEMKSSGAHRVSLGASGSPKLWASLHPSFPNPSQMTAAGAGVTNPELLTPEGDWSLYAKLDESMPSGYDVNIDVLAVQS